MLGRILQEQLGDLTNQIDHVGNFSNNYEHGTLENLTVGDLINTKEYLERVLKEYKEYQETQWYGPELLEELTKLETKTGATVNGFVWTEKYGCQWIISHYNRKAIFPFIDPELEPFFTDFKIERVHVSQHRCSIKYAGFIPTGQWEIEHFDIKAIPDDNGIIISEKDG